MTHRLTHAIAAAMLVSAPAFAQEVTVTTAAPLTGFGLIDAFSAREGAYSKVLDRLSRIDTNVDLGTRPGGVLARLAAAAGPDGWPPRSPDPLSGAIIEGWNKSITDSRLMVDFMEYQASDLTALAAPARDENGRLSLSMTLVEPVSAPRNGDLELLTHGANAVHPIGHMHQEHGAFPTHPPDYRTHADNPTHARVGFFGSF